MNAHSELQDWSTACLREAEVCITHQQRLAETLEAHGLKRQARQAREMLATFVKAYFAMHDCHRTMENRSFSALARTWLSFAVDLDKPQVALEAIGGAGVERREVARARAGSIGFRASTSGRDSAPTVKPIHLPKPHRTSS